MVKIKVPATSANIGVGYDCLGVALDDWASVTFEIIEEGLEIIGCEEAYCNEENLFYVAFQTALAYMHENVSGVRICVESDIPYARGLGSSATCIVAGIVGANALFKNPMNKYEIFALATQLEGHPDNIAPAIFGALCVSFMEEEKPSMIKYGVKKDLLFVTIIPDYEVSTKKAREVLPTTLTYQDAIYQMGRCAALAKALEIGNAVILKKACQDKMQEPYRKKLIKEYDEVERIVKKAEAITMFISGSGSTMIALTQEESIAQEIKNNVLEKFPNWEVRNLKATSDGVQSEVL
ncbi:MAG: homoserine kinase [Longicatena sp.]